MGIALPVPAALSPMTSTRLSGIKLGTNSTYRLVVDTEHGYYRAHLSLRAHFYIHEVTYESLFCWLVDVAVRKEKLKRGGRNYIFFLFQVAGTSEKVSKTEAL